MNERFKKKIAPFHHEQISLNLLNEDDLPFTLAWRNAYREWFNTSETILFADHLNWYEYYKKRTDDFVFIVQDQHKSRVGQAAVYNIDWEKGIGEFGRFLVNPDFSGKSYMKKSAEAMLILCIEQLKLQSLYLQVKPNNERAIHVYSSVGFTFSKEQQSENIKMVYSY